MKNDNEDIIHLPHHVSLRYPKMSMLNRAAQFAPFAALTGYSDSIEDATILNNQKTDETYIDEW